VLSRRSEPGSQAQAAMGRHPCNGAGEMMRLSRNQTKEKET